MYLVFADEFKESRKNFEFYGLSVIYINNSSYQKFKKGFYKRLKELGWNPSIEIKGRYSFSSTKGDTNVSINDRLKFVEKLFDLSKSGSGRYASAQCYYSIGIYNKGTDEEEMYLDLLSKIIRKLPLGKKGGNKNGNNNVIFFLDRNDSIRPIKISDKVEQLCEQRRLFLIERPLSVKSGNETPGIIFADHVGFFISNYLKTNKFNRSTRPRFEKLLKKFSAGELSKEEKEEFLQYVISIRKEDRSVKLLRALKKMTYVE